MVTPVTIHSLIFLCLLALLQPAASYAEAAPGKTYRVSPGGPLQTISEAVKAASTGDTVIVEKGVYNEKVVVDKTLALLGENGPEINGGGKGTVVTIKAPGTVMKGFIVTGSGSLLSAEDAGILIDTAAEVTVDGNTLRDVLFGIYIKGSPHALVTGNDVRGKDVPMPRRGDGIRLWYSSGTKIINNRVSGVRDVVIWWSSDTLLKGNIVEDARYGLHYMSSNHNRFEDNVFRNNFVGGFLMYSVGIEFYRNKFTGNRGTGTGYGVGFKDLDDIVAKDNLIADNRVGIFLDNSPYLIESWNEIDGNVVAWNDIGVSMMPSIKRNAFVGNSFTGNEEQIEVRGGGRLSGNAWGRGGRGNYWSDYVGYDEDGDGIGEIPYRSESLFESLVDKNPSLRIFVFSPAAKALELASKAFPVIKPEPKLTDESPLVRPPHVNIEPDKKGRSTRGLLAVSASMALLPLAFFGYAALGGRASRGGRR
jgi:nitrous oxidase accessory protein